jgi:hypothetical protein
VSIQAASLDGIISPVEERQKYRIVLKELLIKRWSRVTT